MKLQELAVANPKQQTAKVFESYFGSSVNFDSISPAQARGMLKRVRGLIAEHRCTTEFYRSERNPAYIKLVMMEQALAAAATTPPANPQQQAGMQAAQIQQKKQQIQDAIKAKQAEIADLQKQMNDPTMMAMAEGAGEPNEKKSPAEWLRDPRLETQVNSLQATGLALNDPAKGFRSFDDYRGPDMSQATNPMYFREFLNAFARVPGAMVTAFMSAVRPQPAMAESRRARRLREASEIQQAQVVLASQDMVDQVQKMSEQVSAMQFKDLPALVDQIRNEVGVEQSTQYNADASAALSGLLQNLQGAKQQLEAALGVVTGQAPQVPGDNLAAGLPAEQPAAGQEEIADLDAAGADLDAAAAAADTGLGRERR